MSLFLVWFELFITYKTFFLLNLRKNRHINVLSECSLRTLMTSLMCKNLKSILTRRKVSPRASGPDVCAAAVQKTLLRSQLCRRMWRMEPDKHSEALMEGSATWPACRWRLRPVKILATTTHPEDSFHKFFLTLTSSASYTASNANSQVQQILEEPMLSNFSVMKPLKRPSQAYFNVFYQHMSQLKAAGVSTCKC